MQAGHGSDERLCNTCNASRIVVSRNASRSTLPSIAETPVTSTPPSHRASFVSPTHSVVPTVAAEGTENHRQSVTYRVDKTVTTTASSPPTGVVTSTVAAIDHRPLAAPPPPVTHHDKAAGGSAAVGKVLDQLYAKHATQAPSSAATAPVAFMKREPGSLPPALCVGDAMVLYSDAHNSLLACDGVLSSRSGSASFYIA